MGGGVRWGLVGLSQTSPIPRSPDGDKNSLYLLTVRTDGADTPAPLTAFGRSIQELLISDC